MKAYTYKGELSVEDGVFTLEAEQLIVRDANIHEKVKKVAFRLTGRDPKYGTFSIDGKATSRNAIAESQGTGVRYISEYLPVVYKDYPEDQDKAKIELQIDQTQHGCEVNGEWRENDEAYWTFSGDLKPLRV